MIRQQPNLDELNVVITCYFDLLKDKIILLIRKTLKFETIEREIKSQLALQTGVDTVLKNRPPPRIEKKI